MSRKMGGVFVAELIAVNGDQGPRLVSFTVRERRGFDDEGN
jgi:hypothetical protein